MVRRNSGHGIGRWMVSGQFRVVAGVFAAGVAAMAACLLWLDVAAAYALAPYKFTLFVGGVNQVSKLGEAHWYLVPAACVWAWCFFSGNRPYARHVAGRVFLTVAVTGIMVLLLKMLFGRTRPELLIDGGEYAFTFFALDGEWLSFPSGHATTTAAFAGAMAMIWPRWTGLFLAYALLIGATRVIVGAHFPSDVIAGLMLGWGTAMALHVWMPAYEPGRNGARDAAVAVAPSSPADPVGAGGGLLSSGTGSSASIR